MYQKWYSDTMNYIKALKHRLHPLVEADILVVLKIALRCNYPFSTEDLMTWNKHDPAGINVAGLDSGELIGLGAVLNHNDKHSFGGTFIVHEKYRTMKVFTNIQCVKMQEKVKLFLKNIGNVPISQRFRIKMALLQEQAQVVAWFIKFNTRTAQMAYHYTEVHIFLLHLNAVVELKVAVISCVRWRNVYKPVSDLDRRRTIAYWNCVLSYLSINAGEIP
ncbi:UNVERIFIED_CONTAM: hypothetical protein NCL1_31760 [Trichonephila clavipes]